MFDIARRKRDMREKKMGDLADSTIIWELKNKLGKKTEELERLKRTVKFMEDEYLNAHGGSWGKCKYQTENELLRSIIQGEIETLLKDVHNATGGYITYWRNRANNLQRSLDGEK